MKKILVFAFLITFIGQPFAQTKPLLGKAAPQAEKPVQVDTTAPEVVFADLCIQLEGDSICVPTNDAKVASDIIIEFYREHEGNLPTSAGGWILLVFGFLTSAAGTVFVGSTKKIVAFLKLFLKKKANVVAFVAGILALFVTLLIGQWKFDGTTFIGIWGVLAALAWLVYENFLAKKETPKVDPVATA